MTPDMHTFWDPQKGKYVTIPASAVIKPPTDDAELRRKAVVSADAVISSVLKTLFRGFLIGIAIAVAIVILALWHANEMTHAHWTHHEDATGKWIPDKWN